MELNLKKEILRKCIHLSSIIYPLLYVFISKHYVIYILSFLFFLVFL
jgi:dolichol kinase